MKLLRILLTVCCLIITITVIAQEELTESITTDTGLSVKYPTGYFGEVDEDNVIALIDFDTQTFIIIGLGDAAVDFSDVEPESSTEVKDDFINTLSSLGGDIIDGEAVEEFVLNGLPAYIIPFTADFVGTGYVLTFEVQDGVVGTGMMFGAEAEAYTPEMVATFKAIAGSITYDASLAVEAENDETTSEVLPDSSESTDLNEDDTGSTDSGIPSNAILLEDMPEGLILTNTGLQMPMLDGFQFLPGTEYIENAVSLMTGDFQNNITIFDDTFSGMGGMDVINSFLMPTIAAMGGIEEFDPEVHLQTIDVDGRTITYLATPDFVEDDADALGGIYYFIVELLPEGDRIAMVQAIYGNMNDEVNEESLFEFVQAITLTEEETLIAQDAAITAAIDAEATVTCYTVGYEVVTTEMPEATVSCPTNCSSEGSIWGTEIYTNDSSVCKAAVHMGLIDDMGGEFNVSYVEGQAEYVSTTQNDITSSSYGEWDSSFSVSALEEE